MNLKIKIFAAAVAACLALFLVLKLKEPKTFDSAFDPVVNTAKQDHKRVLKAPREKVVVSRSEGVSVPDACLEYWNSVRSLDLQSLHSYPPQLTTVPITNSCRDMPEPLEKTWAQFSKACASFSQNIDKVESEADWQKVGFECFSSLISFRAAIGAHLTRHIPVSEINDEETIVDKIIHGFGKIESNPKEALSEVESSAERLLEIDSSSFIAAKSLAIARTVKVFMVPELYSEQKARDAIERAAFINPEEASSLIEMELAPFLAKLNKPEGSAQLDAKARELAERYPDKGFPYYYLASSAWSAGNREISISYLNEAISRENSERYHSSLKKIKTTKLREKGLFNMSFSVKVGEL